MDDPCDLCMTSQVSVDRTTYCGKTIGIECGCDERHPEGFCGDPGGEVAIVCFDTDNRNGHLSPLIGVKGRKLVLPYTEQGMMDVKEFEKRWTAPGICRQCVFATR